MRLAQLTEEGLKKCRHEYDVLTDTEALMVRGLSDSEQQELMRMLRIMRENLA